MGLFLVECPRLPSASCGGCSQHLEAPMEIPKGLAMEGSLVIKKKKRKSYGRQRLILLILLPLGCEYVEGMVLFVRETVVL